MSDNSHRAEESDRELVHAITGVARQLRSAYREWIQEELKALAARADSLEPLLQGPLREEMQATVRRLRHIDSEELRDCVNNLHGKINEIEEGVYDGVFDAKQYLEEGQIRLEGLVRELISLRTSLDDLWDSHTAPAD